MSIRPCHLLKSNPLICDISLRNLSIIKGICFSTRQSACLLSYLCIRFLQAVFFIFRSLATKLPECIETAKTRTTTTSVRENIW